MYELTCTTLDETVHLDHDHVISSHRTSTGHVVYLRCACGATVMWSGDGTTMHPRSARRVEVAA